MEKLPTLHFLQLNDEQKKVVCSIINCFGTGQHPICAVDTVDGFMTSYLKEIINSKKFKNGMKHFHLPEKDKKTLAEIEEML